MPKKGTYVHSRDEVYYPRINKIDKSGKIQIFEIFMEFLGWEKGDALDGVADRRTGVLKLHKIALDPDTTHEPLPAADESKMQL